MHKSPEITAVICTYNRAHYLEKCINSLFNQTLNRDRYEIIVVDNGSSDNTRKICDKFSDRANFKYIFEPVIGLSHARNTGWQNARGRYVGYIDDDATAHHKWFEKALWTFQNVTPVPEWVGGPVDLQWEVKKPKWITPVYLGALGAVNWGNSHRFLLNNNEWLAGCNSVFRKDILETMEGFDTRLGRKNKILLSGEEIQFQHRLKSIGGKLYYHPDVRIFHFIPKERIEPSFYYRRYYWGGRTDYIMSRTLKYIAYEPVTQKSHETSSFCRLIRSFMMASGLFVSKTDKIHSRIYLSYVLGWVSQILLSTLWKDEQNIP